MLLELVANSMIGILLAVTYTQHKAIIALQESVKTMQGHLLAYFKIKLIELGEDEEVQQDVHHDIE